MAIKPANTQPVNRNGYISKALGTIMLVVLFVTTSCGNGNLPQLFFSGKSQEYLVTLDELASPGFTIITGPEAITTAEFSHNSIQLQHAIQTNNLIGAAQVRFFRSVGVFSLSNGPVDIISEVGEFHSQNNSATAYDAFVHYYTSLPGTTSISTGNLGDAAHAVVSYATDPTNGVRVVQYTVMCRISNLVMVLTMRGRDGTITIDNLVSLAQRQIVQAENTISPNGIQPS